MLKTKNRIIVLVFLFVFSVRFCFGAEEPQRADLLKQKINSSKTAENLDSQLKELMEIYTKENRLNEFYNFLETLEKNRAYKNSPLTYYYQALARFSQIQFLEKGKMWQELFGNKDLYTKDLNKSLAEAKKLNQDLGPLSLRLKFLEWQIKKDNEKTSLDTLEGLFNLVQSYTKTDNDPQIIKDIADELSKEKEINYAKKLYSVYVSKISKTDNSPEELKKLAQAFLAESKVDLAVSLYDAYLEKITALGQDKNSLIKQMFDVAEKFANSGWNQGLDPFFAERVYAKVESSYNIGAFDELSQYRRAYNLERIKEYENCFNEYLKLVNNFPDYKDKDRIYFRLGVLSAYEFDKIDQAREYFLKVANGYPQSQEYLNSLYNLGLLEQWQKNSEKAKEFYNMALAKTKDLETKPEIVNLAASRIKEIDDNKDIEYNLRMFLEGVLNKDEKRPPLQLELFADIAKDYLNESVKFKTISYLTDSGCLQQDFTYLWSGQLGTNQNPLNKNEFDTDYQDVGTKVVNVVLIGPAGIVGGTIEIADIYNK